MYRGKMIDIPTMSDVTWQNGNQYMESLQALTYLRHTDDIVG